MTYFANHFIPTPDVFTTLSHSNSLHHGAVVLFLTYLYFKIEKFFNFCRKMTEFFLLIFFSPYKCHPGEGGRVTTPTVELMVLSCSFKNIFNKVLSIAFSKVIHKKLKKSHIISYVFLYLFSHILRTTSPPLFTFTPHILERVYCVLE